MLLLVFVAGVPFWLALIGYVIGALVIRRYADTLRPDSLSRIERATPIVAKGFLAFAALAGVLLLAVTLLVPHRVARELTVGAFRPATRLVYRMSPRGSAALPRRGGAGRRAHARARARPCRCAAGGVEPRRDAIQRARSA